MSRVHPTSTYPIRRAPRRRRRVGGPAASPRATTSSSCAIRASGSSTV